MIDKGMAAEAIGHFAARAATGRRAALERRATDEQGGLVPARAVLYLRAASAKQDDRNLSIVAQQHICRWRAHELNADVIDEFVDFGSGMSGERPGLDAMLAKLTELQAEAGQLPMYVIARDHARIARDMQVYIRVTWAIERAGAVLNIASVPITEYEAIAGRRPEILSPWLAEMDDRKMPRETDGGESDG